MLAWLLCPFLQDADRFLPRRLFLKNMWVSPDYRRQRLATRLLDAVEQYARQNKVREDEEGGSALHPKR